MEKQTNDGHNLLLNAQFSTKDHGDVNQNNNQRYLYVQKAYNIKKKYNQYWWGCRENIF
jgi:hypothetical protein